MTLDEYLDSTVFYRDREFSRESFVDFMLAESRPDEATIALARRLADSGKYRMMTLNNESLELNLHRIERFGLRDIFEAFFTSCWLGCHQAVAPDLRAGARHLAGAAGTRRVHRRSRPQSRAGPRARHADHSLHHRRAARRPTGGARRRRLTTRFSVRAPRAASLPFHMNTMQHAVEDGGDKEPGDDQEHQTGIERVPCREQLTGSRTEVTNRPHSSQ